MLSFLRRPKHPLDRRVIRWTIDDELTMRGLLDGGVVILGRPGSGKSSFSGFALANGVVSYTGSGGLILSSSPTDLEFWRGIFARQGRSKDLVEFGPKHGHRFNFIEYLCKLGLDDRALAKAIITIGEATDNEDSRTGGGEGEKFWGNETQITIEKACVIVRQAEGTVSIPRLHEFIVSAAQTPDAVRDERWRAQYHWLAFRKAEAREKTDIERMDFDQAKKRWLVQWPAMDNKPRSSVEAGASIPLNVFNQGEVWSLLSRDTTVTPAAMDQGKWVFVDASVGEYGSSGAFILNSWRYATQKHVLTRTPGKWPNPIIIWADEAGKVVNSADSFYLTESRKYGGATVFLAQSMKSFHAALPGHRGQAQAELLLGCFAHKVVHAIGDPDTAEWCSKLCGKRVVHRNSYHQDAGGDMEGMYQMITGGRGMHLDVRESVENVLEAREFMHGLRTGAGKVADAWVLRTGEPFANGSNAIFCSFKR